MSSKHDRQSTALADALVAAGVTRADFSSGASEASHSKKSNSDNKKRHENKTRTKVIRRVDSADAVSTAGVYGTSGTGKRGSSSPARPSESEDQAGWIKINPNTRVAPELLETPAQVGVSLGQDYTRQSVSQCFSGSSGETDLVLGLDFGTANTKVVIMEQGRPLAFAVPFSNGQENPYLLPSRVYLDDKAIYSLQGQGECISGLKLPLLLGEMEPGHEDHVVAFLALVLRQSRGWFLGHGASAFSGFEFIWRHHMGLPASDYRNVDLVSAFKTVLGAAVELSLNDSPDVTRDMAYKALTKTRSVLRDNPPEDVLLVLPEDYEVFPDLVAQIHGYILSDRWDKSRPKFMLVDVGGSTVDACIMNVIETRDGGLRYAFLKSDVSNQGVVFLHRDRLAWIKKCSEISESTPENLTSDLASMSISKDETLPLPGSIREYLVDAEYPDERLCSDKFFYNKYRTWLFDDIIVQVKGKIDREITQWKHLPFLLCGGGSEHPLYRQFIEVMNRPNNTGTVVRLDPIQLSKPDNLLLAPDIDASSYHRLSVAYGLAHLKLGDIIPDDPNEDFEVQPSIAEGQRDDYIGPEHI